MKTLVLTPIQQRNLCRGVLPSGVRPGAMVPLAARIAQETTVEELQDTQSLQRLYIVRRNLERTIGRMLPVEEQSKDVLRQRLFAIRKDIARFECAPVFDLPTIDPSFLSWKTQEGFPAFSVYTLHGNLCKISLARVGNGYTLTMSPSLPQIIESPYLDDNLKESLRAKCINERLRSIELQSRYVGAMPEWVRERIHSFLDAPIGAPQFDFICIVAEAPRWEVNTVREIPVGDPLVIGVHRGLLWLIAAYDLTPAEKLAAELCQGDTLHTTN